MKKTYIEPSMAIAEIKNECMLAGSDPTTHDVLGNRSILSNDRDSYDEDDEDLW